MDTGLQTTSLRPQSPQSSTRLQNLIVQIDNLAEKPVKYTSLSDKRKSTAAKAKGQRQITNQEVQFYLNNTSVTRLLT